MSFIGNYIKGVVASVKSKVISFVKIPSFKLNIKLPSFELPKLPRYEPPKIDTRQNHEKLLEQTTTALIDVERQMSSGGSQILTYMNDLQVNVGGQYIGADIAPPVSVVDGYPVPSKVSIGSRQTSISQKSTPHVQSVSHSIPWGTYSIMASNKFNAVVGAGGIMLHTDGCFDMSSGGRTTISSLYELNLTTSSGNLNIICGHNVNIKGDTVTLQTADRNNQVVVDSNLGVSKNLVVHGSTYVDGELYCQHITAPAVARETSDGSGLYVYVPQGSRLGVVAIDILGATGLFDVYADTDVQCVVSPHTHTYYTIANELHSSNSKVRDLAATINTGATGEAKSPDHGGTGLAS